MRKPLLLFLIVAGCSKGPEADLASIGQARSLAAEWALVNDEAAKGKLTGAYTDAMRNSIREQLRSTAGALTQPGSRYGEQIRALLALPDDAPPAQLRARADQLKQIEEALESA